jgi:hypothetical protein
MRTLRKNSPGQVEWNGGSIRFALSRIDDTPSSYKKGLRHFESVDYLSLVQILREVVLFLHKEIGLPVDRLATRDRAAGARRRK